MSSLLGCCCHPQIRENKTLHQDKWSRKIGITASELFCPAACSFLAVSPPKDASNAPIKSMSTKQGDGDSRNLLTPTSNNTWYANGQDNSVVPNGALAYNPTQRTFDSNNTAATPTNNALKSQTPYTSNLYAINCCVPTSSGFGFGAAMGYLSYLVLTKWGLSTPITAAIATGVGAADCVAITLVCLVLTHIPVGVNQGDPDSASYIHPDLTGRFIRTMSPPKQVMV